MHDEQVIAIQIAVQSNIDGKWICWNYNWQQGKQLKESPALFRFQQAMKREREKKKRIE